MGLEDLAPVWWFLVYATMIYIVVALVRRVVEHKWKGLKTSAAWRDVVLFVSPPILGGLLALPLSSFPMLEYAHVWWMRIGLGLSAGFFSATVYKLLMLRLKAAGVPVPEETTSSEKTPLP